MPSWQPQRRQNGVVYGAIKEPPGRTCCMGHQKSQLKTCYMFLKKISQSWYLWRDNDGAVDAAAINAASQSVNQMSNNLSSGKLNYETRKYNWDMYNQQRSDYWEDVVYNQKYNSPEAQMARLKQAGLNPNLVYGKGADAVMQSSPQSTHALPYSPKPTGVVNFDAGSVLGSYVQMRAQNAQLDQVRAQTQLLETQKLLAIAQTGKTIQDTDTSKFTLGQSQRLADTNAQALQLTVDKMSQDLDLRRQENARAWETQTEQILNMQKSRAKTDADMKKIDADIENMKNDIDLRRKMLEYQKSADSKAPFWYKEIKEILTGKYGIVGPAADNILNDARKVGSSPTLGGALKGALGPVRSRVGGN